MPENTACLSPLSVSAGSTTLRVKGVSAGTSWFRLSRIVYPVPWGTDTMAIWDDISPWASSNSRKSLYGICFTILSESCSQPPRTLPWSSIRVRKNGRAELSAEISTEICCGRYETFSAKPWWNETAPRPARSSDRIDATAPAKTSPRNDLLLRSSNPSKSFCAAAS